MAGARERGIKSCVRASETATDVGGREREGKKRHVTIVQGRMVDEPEQNLSFSFCSGEAWKEGEGARERASEETAKFEGRSGTTRLTDSSFLSPFLSRYTLLLPLSLSSSPSS